MPPDSSGSAVSYTHLDVYKRQAAIMVNALVNDIGIQPGEKVMLIVNLSLIHI